MTFESTGLWMKSLAHQGNEFDGQREILRQAFIGFRAHTKFLLGEISVQLPQLTAHDITHIDALWIIADEIAGAQFPLNPAEAFVLGGAFLLHDAAHVCAAYEDGLDGIKESDPWRDLIAQRFDNNEPEPGSSKERLALFQILRQLHATQAQNLAVQSWKVPGESESIHLLENYELRDYYGGLIGSIAASHHWPVHKVVAEFEHRHLNAPGFISPAKWQVDALKIALLLRTADAAHLDSTRAPWFLFALRQPKGISEEHWKFQAKMGQVSRNSHDELRITSGSAFSRDERQAWWLAYDVALLIDRELRDAQAILRDFERPRFAATSVENASDPEKFANNVATDGWEPANIMPYIGDIPSILKSFGGSALYGDKPLAALRELIQNAADAVRALRALGQIDDKSGEIEVRLEMSKNESWLHVTDTGIGMSRYVLTNVLLDFGKSLWVDESLRTELPGLASSGFGSVGKFGIGFFSVFMLGDKVRVTTRRYKKPAEEINDQLLLEFEDGLDTRPTLSAPTDADLLYSPGTRVSVRLHRGVLASFYQKSSTRSALQYFRSIVASICPTLDVCLRAQLNNGAKKKLIQPGDWVRISDSNLLERTKDAMFRRPSKLLPLKDQSGNIVGRVGCGRLYSEAVVTHGGIAAGRIRSISGVLLGENNFDLARNESRPIASARAWYEWANRWLDAGYESSPETLMNLHPLCPERDLRVYGVKDGFISMNDLANWIKARTVVKIVEGFPVHEGQDDVGEFRFDDEFELYDESLALPESNQKFVSLVGIEPIDYRSRFVTLLEEVWGNYTEAEEFSEIGEVMSTEIFREVTIYSRER